MISEVTMSYREKYFEGYQSGKVYRLEMTDQQRMLKKFSSASLIFVFFAMGLAAGVQNVAANKGYLAVPYVLALLSGCYCCLGVINMLVSRRDVTEFEYKEYLKQIGYGAACAMYAAGFTALIHLLFLIIGMVNGSSGAWRSELLALLCMGVSCGCAAGIYQIEKKTRYILISGTFSEVFESSESEAETES